MTPMLYVRFVFKLRATALGIVGVGGMPDAAGLGPFDGLYADHTLRYALD